jgi:hypothetical protein
MAEQALIHQCNDNDYICVMGEITDYYGVHKIMAFDICPVSSGNEVTYHFLELAYSFEKTMKLLKSLGIPTPRNPHYQVLAIPICLSPHIFQITNYLAYHNFCSNTLHTTTTIE